MGVSFHPGRPPLRGTGERGDRSGDQSGRERL